MRSSATPACSSRHSPRAVSTSGRSSSCIAGSSRSGTRGAILLVSLELEEVLSLSDRILVMFEGEIVGEYTPDVTPEELGIAMTGGAREQVVA